MRTLPLLIVLLLLAPLTAAGSGPSDPDEAEADEDSGRRTGDDGDRDGSEGLRQSTDPCARERDDRIAEADEELAEERAEAEQRRDERLADDEEDREEAQAEYDEAVAEARAEHDREVRRAHEEYEDCREDQREDVDVEDDDDGFSYRHEGGRGVAVDARRAAGRVQADGVEFEARIESVLEYHDEDGNGAYDLGEPVVQRFGLRDAAPNVTAVGDRRVVSHALGDGRLELHYRPGADGDVKFDVVLRDFPFAASGTRLAVGAAAVGGTGLRVVEVDGAPAVAGTGGGRVGYLSWVQHVEVDGAAHAVGWSVHVSQSADRESAIIYWSYPAGDLVVHDPVLGTVKLPVERLGDAAVYAAAVAVAVAVAVLGYAWRRRFAP